MPVKGRRIALSDGIAPELPDSPGVYQLETDTEVLYIGMARRSIRSQVATQLESGSVDCASAATHVTAEVHAKPTLRLRELLRENLAASGRLPKCNGAIPAA